MLFNCPLPSFRFLAHCSSCQIQRNYVKKRRFLKFSTNMIVFFLIQNFIFRIHHEYNLRYMACFCASVFWDCQPCTPSHYKYVSNNLFISECYFGVSIFTETLHHSGTSGKERPPKHDASEYTNQLIYSIK